jgi:uncharacterized membrane protein YciS (DUF1049 family)
MCAITLQTAVFTIIATGFVAGLILTGFFYFETKAFEKKYKERHYQENPWDNGDMYCDEFGLFIPKKNKKTRA